MKEKHQMCLSVMRDKTRYIHSLIKKIKRKEEVDEEVIVALAEIRDQFRSMDEDLTEMIEEMKKETGKSPSFFSFHERKRVKI